MVGKSLTFRGLITFDAGEIDGGVMWWWADAVAIDCQAMYVAIARLQRQADNPLYYAFITFFVVDPCCC